jgi:hypothetical protein
MTDSKNQTLETLAVIERGDTEQIRITLEQFTTDDGKERVYCSARKWYKSKEGQWAPTKSGLSIRKTELMQWGKALRAALDAMNDSDGGNRFARSGRQPTAPQSANMPGDPDWDQAM